MWTSEPHINLGQNTAGWSGYAIKEHVNESTHD